MAAGISSPARANGNGGLLIVTKDQHIRSLVGVALGEGDSNNPFQDLGLGEEMIFDIADPGSFNAVADKITRIFQGFEESELAQLQDREDNLSVEELSEGEFNMKVFFVNLQTGQADELGVVGNASGVSVS